MGGPILVKQLITGLGLYQILTDTETTWWRICGDHWNGSSWMINDITSPTPAGWYTIRSKLNPDTIKATMTPRPAVIRLIRITRCLQKLNEGEMRIILRWPKTNPVTAHRFGFSHLQIPYLTPRIAGTECDGDSDKTDKCHLSRYTTQDNATSSHWSQPVTHETIINILILLVLATIVTLDQDHNSKFYYWHPSWL